MCASPSANYSRAAQSIDLRSFSSDKLLANAADVAAVCSHICSTGGGSAMCECNSSPPAALGFTGQAVTHRHAVIAISEVAIYGCNRTMSATQPKVFTYSKDLTPRLMSVYPSRGSTAGGTQITLNGVGFGTNASAVTVSILGIACSVQSVTATQVICVTGYHGPTNETNPGKGMVLVKVKGHGYATASADTYWYVDLWSRKTTWGGDPPPIEGDSVVIPKGQTVLLDISPPKLFAVTIQGTLVFDRKDLNFDAHYIIILKGTLEVGTEEEPFLHKATITLHGHPKSPELPVYGAKVIAVREGTLDLHGAPKLRSWTMLNATSFNGSTALSLIKPVDWEVGSDIVIASTDFEKEHAEQVTITSLSADGHHITFAPALKWTHLGETRLIAGHPFEYRAEVGLLSRNIVVQGDECSHTCSTAAIGAGVGDGLTTSVISEVSSTDCSCVDTGAKPMQYGVLCTTMLISYSLTCNILGPNLYALTWGREPYQPDRKHRSPKSRASFPSGTIPGLIS